MAVVIVSAEVAGAIVRVKVWLAWFWTTLLSETVIVTLPVKAAVGVPPICPAEFTVRDPGRLANQEYGAVPPVAATCAL